MASMDGYRWKYRPYWPTTPPGHSLQPKTSTHGQDGLTCSLRFLERRRACLPSRRRFLPAFRSMSRSSSLVSSICQRRTHFYAASSAASRRDSTPASHLWLRFSSAAGMPRSLRKYQPPCAISLASRSRSVPTGRIVGYSPPADGSARSTCGTVGDWRYLKCL